MYNSVQNLLTRKSDPTAGRDGPGLPPFSLFSSVTLPDPAHSCTRYDTLYPDSCCSHALTPPSARLRKVTQACASQTDLRLPVRQCQAEPPMHSCADPIRPQKFASSPVVWDLHSCSCTTLPEMLLYEFQAIPSKSNQIQVNTTNLLPLPCNPSKSRNPCCVRWGL